MPDLIETVEDGVATLTLNRPENLNALSEDIRLGLLESIHRLGADDQVGCIVLTGAGRGFCAGGDVKTMAGRSSRGFEERAAGIQQSNRIPMLMHNTPKVIIGMINGVAAGAGLSMACACDLRIAGSVCAVHRGIHQDRPVGRLGRHLDADAAGRHRQGAGDVLHRRHGRRG